MDLSIIIVNWNSLEFLGKCIASIKSQTSRLAYEIIVVDSGSFDGSRDMLARTNTEVIFVQCEQNVGFAKANNLGYSRSRGRNLLFLNPDTELMGPAINILSAQLERLPDAGVLGARLLSGDGTVQTSCLQSFPTLLNQLLDSELLRSRFPRWRLWGMSPLFCATDAAAGVEVVSGACMLLKRPVFESVGLFSTDYFMYSEDMDLCLKVLNQGWRNYYIPTAVITHYGGGSSRKSASVFSSVMMVESLWRYLRKNRGVTYGLAYRLSMTCAACVRIVLLEVGRRWRHLALADQAGAASLTKWRAILRWSLGMESWVSKYR